MDEGRKSRKFSRLSCLRRRRRHHHPPKAGDDSDLSEGFESDSSHDSARASEGSDSGSDKSLEGGGTAFDAETDSEMNSQESRSDLEDMEDEEGMRSPSLEPSRARSEAPETLNGPLGPNEASLASNLQAMSTQMFQTKRSFRLAPTFSNLLLQPSTEAHTLASRGPCVNGDVEKAVEPGTRLSAAPLLEAGSGFTTPPLLWPCAYWGTQGFPTAASPAGPLLLTSSFSASHLFLGPTLSHSTPPCEVGTSIPT